MWAYLENSLRNADIFAYMLDSDSCWKPPRVCVYCKLVFISETDFKSHLQNKHFPTVSKESTDQLPVTSAF